VGVGAVVGVGAGVAEGAEAVTAIAEVVGSGAIEEPDEGFVEPQAASGADAISRPRRRSVWLRFG
jgi:hypothetical protein